MTKLRYYAAVWLFDLAAHIYPLTCKKVGQAHHVGDNGQKWLHWSIERDAA